MPPGFFLSVAIYKYSSTVQTTGELEYAKTNFKQLLAML